MFHIYVLKLVFINSSLFDDGDDFDFTIKDSKDTKPINKKSPPKKDDKKKVDSDDVSIININ